MKKTNNLRIVSVKPLISPEKLKTALPASDVCSKTVVETRSMIDDILNKKNPRLLAIVGPCSIHNSETALQYAEKLNLLRKRIESRILVVMRVYFEKPRTTIGWKGLITDPHLDGSYDIDTGLKTARKLLIDINRIGLPCGSEMLDPIIPQYISDLISWAAIGARTTESQTHREMASGLSMPTGFKNGTSGNLQLAVDALESARHPHSFIGIDSTGKTSVFKTRGNMASHVILRGGRSGPNYYEENVEEAEKLISARNIDPALIIDCSHANSGKEYRKQSRVLTSVIDQKKRGRDSIVGFMLESNIEAGNQKIPEDKERLKFGVSVTDGCIGWEETEKILLGAFDRLDD